MLNRIIGAALSNRVAVLVIAGIVAIAGLVCMMHTDVDIFPDLNAPTVVVMTEAPGLAPEEVERVVTYPVETALNGANDVRRVRSTSSSGFSVVWVEFDWDADIFHARQTVAEKLSEVSGKLPASVGTPVIGPQSSILGEIMIIGLSSDSLSMTELRTIADRTLAPRLLALGGVSQVSVIGGDAEEFQILLSPPRMQALGVSLDEVREAAASVNANASGGIINDFGNEYIVKADISTSSLEEIGSAVVKANGNSAITLADVATIRRGPSLPRIGAASVKAHPAVLLTVTKQPAVSTIALTEEIDGMLAETEPTLPADVTVATDIFRQSDFIGHSITNLQRSLLEGAIFVVIVLFFFLMDLRTTLISLVALPLSIIVTLLVLHIMGMTINTMSLGGIAIAIGSLVDDAIVDVENVYKRLRLNAALPENERRPLLRVVYDASCEVRLPILNSSLIIVASFLPLFLLTGIEGRMLQPLGISFIVALAASTLVALTVTPVLCVYLLGSKKANAALSREPSTARHLGAAYRRMLESAMAHKKAVLWATGAAFVGACVLFFTLGRSFLPPFNEGSLTINVSALPGISLEESNRLGTLAEKIILQTPEVRTTARKTGRAELDEHSLGSNVSEIEAPYVLDHGRDRTEMVRDLRHRLSALPGVNIEIGQPISHRIDAMLSGAEAQIAVKIYGDNLTTLHSLATEAAAIMKEVPGVVDVNVEQLTGRPQLDVRPVPALMAAYGLTNQAFASSVATLLAGEEVSQVYEGNLAYPLTIRVEQQGRESIEALRRLVIDTPKGKVPLGQIAEISSTTGPNAVNRENVSRRILVSANVDGSDIRGAVDEIRHRLEGGLALPQGYHVQYGGQFESEQRASRTLLLASLGALVVIFLLLLHEYRSVSQSLIILLNMPLAVIGGVVILRLTSGNLNIPAIIGFISLLGITTRNGMLLMSRYNSLAAEGESLHDRIIHGSCDRLNPIIMTALTSALALLPIALKGGEPGNEIQSPMAIVILGGLITSTVLNVFVVPISYWLSERRKK